MELQKVVADIADAIVAIDETRVAFKAFQPGAGPYGEPQLIRGVVERLRARSEYRGIATRRTPDVLIPQAWALEIKLARPFGDNGKEAENWSVNLLHPYRGNVSVLGDCLKLESWAGPERRAAIVVGYEHTPAQIELQTLFASFEAIAKTVIGIDIGPRLEAERTGLVHPVHQQLKVVAWEVRSRSSR